MYKAQTVAFFSLTLAALGLTGCYNNEKTTHTKENRLKTEFTEQEQQTLKNNMVAIHSTQNAEAIAQLPQGFKFVNDGYFTVAVGTNSFPPLLRSKTSSDSKLVGTLATRFSIGELRCRAQ